MESDSRPKKIGYARVGVMTLCSVKKVETERRSVIHGRPEGTVSKRSQRSVVAVVST